MQTPNWCGSAPLQRAPNTSTLPLRLGSWSVGIWHQTSGWQHAPSALYLRSSGLHSTTRGRCQGISVTQHPWIVSNDTDGTDPIFGASCRWLKNLSISVGLQWAPSLKLQQRFGVSNLFVARIHCVHGMYSWKACCDVWPRVRRSRSCMCRRIQRWEPGELRSDLVWPGNVRTVIETSRWFHVLYFSRGWTYLLSSVLFKHAVAIPVSYTLNLLQ